MGFVANLSGNKFIIIEYVTCSNLIILFNDLKYLTLEVNLIVIFCPISLKKFKYDFILFSSSLI